MVALITDPYLEKSVGFFVFMTFNREKPVYSTQTSGRRHKSSGLLASLMATLFTL
jgi:hypothetical protein